MRTRFEFLAVALLLTACMGYGPATLTPGYITDGRGTDSRRVVQVIDYTSFEQWRNSPYFRVSDPPYLPRFPLTVSVVNNGQACLLPNDVAALNPLYIACPSGWRHRRP